MNRFTVLMVGVLCAAPAVAPENKLTCTISKVEKHVEIQKDGGDWIEAAPDLQLSEGDQVHTGFKSSAVLKFKDGSELTVKPMTLVRLQRIEQAGNTVSTQVQLRLGEIKAEVGHQTSLSSDFKVKTATCTASVRGTVIDRICFTPALGTQIEMGKSGSMDVSTGQGSVNLSHDQDSSVASGDAKPKSAEETETMQCSTAEPTGGGLTEGEAAALEDVGVPKAAPLTEGGGDAVDNSVDEIERFDPDFANELNGPPPPNDNTPPDDGSQNGSNQNGPNQKSLPAKLPQQQVFRPAAIDGTVGFALVGGGNPSSLVGLPGMSRLPDTRFPTIPGAVRNLSTGEVINIPGFRRTP